MTGIVTVSFELELGWGMHDQGEYDHLSPSRKAENDALDRLLSLCDEVDIPITFNVVGHLAEETCEGSHVGPYTNSWWLEDPGTNKETDPLFYAPDMIKKIQDNSIDHEFATHTYSHLLVEDASPELLDHELCRVEDIHASINLPAPKSIVLPRHQTPSYDILSNHGIRTIRRPVKNYENQIPTPIGKLYWILTRSHPITNLEKRDSLIETKCTPHPSISSVLLPQGQREVGHPVFQAIPLQMRQRLHKCYLREAIDRAAETGQHLHLWSHLYNISNNIQWKGVEDGIIHLAKKRDEGEVTIERMMDLPFLIKD